MSGWCTFQNNYKIQILGMIARGPRVDPKFFSSLHDLFRLTGELTRVMFGDGFQQQLLDLTDVGLYFRQGQQQGYLVAGDRGGLPVERLIARSFGMEHENGRRQPGPEEQHRGGQ